MPPKKTDLSYDIAEIHNILSDMPKRFELKDLIKSAVDEAVKCRGEKLRSELKKRCHV